VSFIDFLFRNQLHLCLFAISLSVFVQGCSESGDSAPGGMGAGGMPPVRAVVLTVKNTEFVNQQRFIGSVAAREFVEIKSEINGAVVQVKYQEGQAVKAGDVLVQLDETKLKAQLRQAQADLRENVLNHKMDSQLLKEDAISQQVFDQSDAALDRSQAIHDLRVRQFQDTTIIAPFDGIIGEKLVSKGQVISPQQVLSYLVMLDPIDIQFQMPERFIGQIANESLVRVSARAFPGKQFTGKVHYIAAYVDSNTRTVQVKARIENPDHTLKPGMFCEVQVEIERVTDAILIPETALFRFISSSKASIYTVGSDGRISMTSVKMGRRLPGVVQIVDGLSDGDQIIVEGTQKAFPGGTLIPAPPESAQPYVDLLDAVGAKGKSE